MTNRYLVQNDCNVQEKVSTLDVNKIVQNLSS